MSFHRITFEQLFVFRMIYRKNYAD